MDNKTLCITYSGPVNDVNVHNFMMQINAELANPTRIINHIYIPINSQGGGVNVGIVLYNYLRGLGRRITTHNIGFVNSIANVVFVAGDKRYASPNTTFLFHGVKSPQYPPMSFVEMSENLSQLEKDERRIENIIVDRTGFGPIQIRKLFREGQAIDLETAKKQEIIHDIRDLNIPSTAHNVIGNLIQAQQPF